MLAAARITFALVVKRPHDSDKSATYGALLFVPVIGFYVHIIECGCLAEDRNIDRFGPGSNASTQLTDDSGASGPDIASIGAVTVRAKAAKMAVEITLGASPGAGPNP